MPRKHSPTLHDWFDRIAEEYDVYLLCDDYTLNSFNAGCIDLLLGWASDFHSSLYTAHAEMVYVFGDWKKEQCAVHVKVLEMVLREVMLEIHECNGILQFMDTLSTDEE